MMDRVRSSRSMSGGMEVAHRGVAGRLRPTLGDGPDVCIKSLKPILVLPCLSRPMAGETSEGKCMEK